MVAPIFAFIGTVKEMTTERLALVCLLVGIVFMGFITCQVLGVATEVRVAVAELRITVAGLSDQLHILQKGDPTLAAQIKALDTRLTLMERTRGQHP